jgi:5-carboxymethyl-2-hydroxymuconate isomerase
MRLARVRTPHGIRLAAEQDGQLLPLAAQFAGLPPWRAVSAAATTSVDRAAQPLPGELLAPLEPGKIVAIGLNYRDHAKECGLDLPAEPLIFTKFVTSVNAPNGDIVVDPTLTSRVDWEVELGVVIGARARHVPRDMALSYVAGYVVANDVSARDLQFRDTQWVRGKSLDTFCPLGPVLVSADEIPDPQALRLQTTVNGELMQDSSTSEMIFDVAELISFCSRSFTLEPGDLLLTGTPWGCGEFMTPKRSLGDGDLVTTSVERIGELANRVRHVAVSSRQLPPASPPPRR